MPVCELSIFQIKVGIGFHEKMRQNKDLRRGWLQPWRK